MPDGRTEVKHVLENVRSSLSATEISVDGEGSFQAFLLK